MVVIRSSRYHKRKAWTRQAGPWNWPTNSNQFNSCHAGKEGKCRRRGSSSLGTEGGKLLSPLLWWWRGQLADTEEILPGPGENGKTWSSRIWEEGFGFSRFFHCDRDALILAFRLIRIREFTCWSCHRKLFGNENHSLLLMKGSW